MKKPFGYICVLCMVSCLTLLAQKKSGIVLPDPFRIQFADTANGLKNDLYSVANEWMAITFRGNDEAILMNEKSSGKLIAKGVMTYDVNKDFSPGGRYIIKYIATIDVKDGKFRVTMSDFIATNYIEYQTTSNGFIVDVKKMDFPSLTLDTHGERNDTKEWTDIKTFCYNKANELIADLDKKMHATPEKF